MRIIKKIPIPLAGLMLALAAAGNLVSTYGTKYKNIFGCLAALVLLALLAKIITDPKDIKESLKNPLIASVAPTFTMGLMILSTYIKPILSGLSLAIWILSLLLHCLLIIYFTQKFILNFDIKKVFPSYFIVYVGLVVASITAPAYKLNNVGQVIFWFGFISYICLLIVVLYRLFVIKQIPEPALPTIVIMAAPASLCLAGYLASFQNKNIYIVGFLGVLSLIMFLGVIIYIPKLLLLKFYPSYSSFTFPLVISAIAMKQTNIFLLKIHKPISGLIYFVKFQEALAVLIVLYVFVRYIQFILIENKLSQTNQVSNSI